MSLTLHFDCAIDPLVTRLAAQLAAEVGDDPFARDVLLVPSMGAGRWLRRRITDRHGVSCALDIDLPGRFLWSTIARLLPGVAPQSPFEPEVARWILLPLLQRIAADPSLEAERLVLLHARFDGRHPGPDELLPLAQAIARQFARLLNHRRDWLDAWASGRTLADDPDADADGGREPGRQAWPEGRGQFGRHERWMSWLWREVLERMPGVSQEHPYDRFLHWLNTTGQAGARQRIAALGVRRVLVFGMPQISREQMGLLGHLASVLDLIFLVPDPCQEFWQDIVSPRALAQIQQTRPDIAWLYEHEPAILGSWGRMHRDYLAQLRELEERLQSVTSVQVDDLFRDREVPAPRNRLQALTQSILTLSDDPWTSLADSPSAGQHEPDESLQIHAAPGRRRQVEVLRDRLLQCFSEIPDLMPDQVLVVAPDIDVFVDAIDGAFGDGLIPYVIDGRRRVTDPVIKAMLQLLQVASRPLSLDSIAVLLEEPALAGALGIDAADTTVALRWLERAGFREDTAPDSKHGWRAALDRLWYGLAVAAEHSTVPYALGQTVAVAGVSPSSLQLLARLERLVEVIAELARLDTDQPDVLLWCERVAAGSGRWLSQSGQSAGQQPLLDLVRGIAGEVRSARAGAPSVTADRSDAGLCRLSIVAFTRLLEDAATSGVGLQQASAGVLFASVDAVRPYSARVTACLGFSDQDFPRQAAPLEFDLIRLRPRFGDPSPALADRGAFLDLIAQTRERLLFFFDGTDLRSNERLNPSMLIGELLDYVQRQPGQDQWTVLEHPLMRFLPAAFDRDRLPSFDAAAFRAARVLVKGGQRGLQDGQVPATMPIEPSIATVPADELSQADWVNVLSRPVRAYLRRSLLVDLPRSLTDTDRVEPLDVLDDLGDEFRGHAQQLLDVLPDDAGDTRLATIWPMQPHLPMGASGLLAGQALRAIRTDRIERTAVVVAATGQPVSAFVPQRLLWRGRWLRTARIQPDPAADGSRLQFVWSAYKWNVRSLIDAWVCHQVARLLAPGGVVTTWWLGDGDSRKLVSPASTTRIDADGPGPEQNLLALATLAAELMRAPGLVFPRTWLAWTESPPAGQRTLGPDRAQTRRLPKTVTDAFEKELSDPDRLILFRSEQPDLEEVLTQTQSRYGWFREGLQDG